MKIERFNYGNISSVRICEVAPEQRTLTEAKYKNTAICKSTFALVFIWRIPVNLTWKCVTNYLVCELVCDNQPAETYLHYSLKTQRLFSIQQQVTSSQ